jgi:hypothetical protein
MATTTLRLAFHAARAGPHLARYLFCGAALNLRLHPFPPNAMEGSVPLARQFSSSVE